MSDDIDFQSRIDFAKWITDHNMSLINLADTKAGIILGINGIILALLFGVEKVGLDDYNKILMILTGTILGLSSFFSFMVIIPRLTKPNTNTNIYFMSIAKAGLENLLNSWERLSRMEILNDYIRNIHNLSVIQKKKYQYLQISIILVIGGIALLTVSVFYYFS